MARVTHGMIAAAAGLAVLLAGCGGDGPSAPQADGAAAARSKAKGARGKGRGPGGNEVRVPVIVNRATLEDMEAFLDGSATLEAEDSVEVVSQATGVVVEIVVEEGARVSKGALLARLAYEDLELAEARAKSELERLRADFARAEQLADQKFISTEDYQRVKYDLARAEIDWRTAELALERTRIEAPIRGTVSERLIRNGQLVRENEGVYRVVDFNSTVAPVYVPERYLSDLHTGQAAWITSPALAGRRIPGRVERVSPVVDGQSGTVRVIVGFERDDSLRPGMFTNVQLVLDAHRGVVTVPKKALVYEDEAPHVFVVEGGHASRRPLVLGYQDESRAEVVEGLATGEVIVLVGQSTLKDGSAVAAEDESGNAVEIDGGNTMTAGDKPPAGKRRGSPPPDTGAGS